jgi:hypothetical protein
MTARKALTIAEHIVHTASGVDHQHGPKCGHPSAKHAGQHVDYLVDGHAHHAHEGHWDECDVHALNALGLWRAEQQ